MNRFAVATLAILLGSAIPALADSKPSADEAKKLTDAMTALGFSGGELEKETEGSGVFEVDDAKDKGGAQFDLKFDKDFKLLSVTRD